MVPRFCLVCLFHSTSESILACWSLPSTVLLSSSVTKIRTRRTLSTGMSSLTRNNDLPWLYALTNFDLRSLSLMS